jgi:N-acetyl-anhydromuramyl-L-alanine amidase AmpD
MIDLTTLETIQAKWFTPVVTVRQPRVIVVHDMEAPESSKTARNVGTYFADPRDDQNRPVKASAHLGVDDKTIIRYVRDNDIAYAAPGCNSDGLQIELAGYGAQTADQWLDDFSTAMLTLAAYAIGDWCRKYDIPPVHLTNAQLLAGERGIVGHVQVSQVYHKSDHSDPGAHFPWDFLIDNVQSFLDAYRDQT